MFRTDAKLDELAVGEPAVARKRNQCPAFQEDATPGRAVRAI